MAKFDIETPETGNADCGMWGSDLKGEVEAQANNEPAPRARRLDSNCTRMRGGRKGLGSFVRGMASPGSPTRIYACFLAVTSVLGSGIGSAAADPTTRTTPDPPARTEPIVVGPGGFRPSWDLDGTYLWLGPTAAASHVDETWDSTIGGHAAILRVRERAAIGVIGGMFGATLWTERDGGRLWLDAVIGTRLGRMVGVSAGPIVELSELNHPRIGASLGLWAFIGVTPFARVGIVDELGAFAEIGVHIALPVLRR